MPRQDVENDIGGVDPIAERLAASRLHRGKPVGQHRRENLDHLTVAVIRALQLMPHPRQTDRQRPILERGSVPERAGLPGEHRHVMPGIVDRLAATEAARVIADDRAFLADDDALGIGLELDRPADPRELTEYLLLSNRTRQVFETD